MHADVPNHEPSLLLMNCGDARQIRPSLGSWLTYGLGSENQNLPGFVAMCPGGYPIQETQNWQCGLSARRVSRHVHRHAAHEDRAADRAHPQRSHLAAASSASSSICCERLNDRHLQARQDDAALEARIQSFELAFRMQTEAADAFDVSREPQHIRDMYGPGVQARQIADRPAAGRARRALRAGLARRRPAVGQPRRHRSQPPQARPSECDQAIGALLADLKQRGLLDDTLVIWGGEFGRTPTVELPKKGRTHGKINGRDHNHYGFTMWLAGGGVRGGYVHGATDEFGFKAVENRVHVHDLHATILHLLGFDHEKLTYRYAGRDFRLTDVHGRVVRELIA